MTERVLHGPSVVLSAADCIRFDGLLVRALADARLRDATVPASVVEICADVHQVAARFKAEALTGGGSRTYDSDTDKAMPAWFPEDWLSTRKAARLAGVSPSYLCRVVRRGDVTARRQRGGGFEIAAASLAVWLGRRDQAKAAGDDERPTRRAL